jgi:phage-related baseplate assembly protein
LSNSVESLNNLPEIDFVNKDVDTLLAGMIAEYQDTYYKATGEKKILAGGDPVRIWIYAQALRIYTAYQLIDRAAKNNLLKYSSGGYLENLGARIGVTRKGATTAKVSQKFSLAQKQATAVAIPNGTRVSAGGEVFFATIEDTEIKAGSTEIEVIVECTEPGTIGNGYIAGQITTLVDPIPYITGTVNTSKSQGGTDTEDDDSLRERIFTKPESFSVAGPVGAYEYFTKEYNSSITDVNVISPEPGKVSVYFILENGELPEDGLIQAVGRYLSDDTRRPLTDSVTVAAPGIVNYNVDIEYYIKKPDQGLIDAIKTAVNNAVAEYINWQKSKIGRDINPSKLISMVMNAGASRVAVNSPVYTAVGDTEIAIAAGEAMITAHDNPEELEDE